MAHRIEPSPARVAPLSARFVAAGGAVPGPAPGAVGEAPHVLACLRYSADSSASGRADRGAAPALVVPLPQLGGEQLVEVWSSAEPVSAGESRGFRLAESASVLFGSAEIEAVDLEADTFDAYGRLLSLVAERGLALARIWNVLPRLHEGAPEFDRYMQFCQGRARAFERHFGPAFERRLPACSAVGSRSGAGLVYFLAARGACRHLESPRQVSAYRYPRRYGPRSPSFARATLAPERAGGWLVISGTASILGHASAHPGDVVAQTEETLRNIRVLVHGPDGIDVPLGSAMPLAKVYVRDPAELERVREVVERELDPGADVLYLAAEICRPELLVEIEGLAAPNADRGVRE